MKKFYRCLEDDRWGEYFTKGKVYEGSVDANGKLSLISNTGITQLVVRYASDFELVSDIQPGDWIRRNYTAQGTSLFTPGKRYEVLDTKYDDGQVKAKIYSKRGKYSWAWASMSDYWTKVEAPEPDHRTTENLKAVIFADDVTDCTDALRHRQALSAEVMKKFEDELASDAFINWSTAAKEPKEDTVMMREHLDKALELVTGYTIEKSYKLLADLYAFGTHAMRDGLHIPLDKIASTSIADDRPLSDREKEYRDHGRLLTPEERKSPDAEQPTELSLDEAIERSWDTDVSQYGKVRYGV